MNGLTTRALMAVYRKEISSLIRWTPAGLVLIGVLCWMTMPSRAQDSHHSEAKLMLNLGVGVAILAFASGLYQSLPEIGRDARGFLLHRPITPSSIYLVKLMAAISLFAVSVVPPLIVVAIHLELIGMQRMPASWLQTLPVSIGAMLIFLAIYPATLWTVHRDARWMGTKWLPVLFGAAVAFPACALLFAVHSLGTFVAFAAIIIVTYGILIHASLHTFAHQTFKPSPSSPESMSVTRGIGLFVASLVVVTMAALLLLSFAQPRYMFADYRTYQLSCSSAGDIWETEAVWSNTIRGSSVKVIAGRKVTGQSGEDGELEPIPDDWEEATTVVLSGAPRRDTWAVKFHYSGVVRNAPPRLSMQKSVFYDRAGRFYLYDDAAVNSSFACITPRGVFEGWERPRGRFIDAWLIQDASLDDSAGQEMLIADRDGIYRVSLASKTIEKIIETPVAQVGFLGAGGNVPGRIWIASGTELKRFTIGPPREGTDVAVEASGQWPLAPPAKSESSSVAETGDDVIAVMTTQWRDRSVTRFRVYRPDGSLRDRGRVRLHPNPDLAYRDREAICIPPALIAATMAVEFVLVGGVVFGSASFWGPVAVHIILAMLLAFWIGHRNALSQRKRIAWVIAAAGGGIGAALAMIAIYRQPVYEACPDCDRPRRVDLQHCEACGSNWKPAEQRGNEIFERQPPGALLTSSG